MTEGHYCWVEAGLGRWRLKPESKARASIATMGEGAAPGTGGSNYFRMSVPLL